jgi:hypothetical protein
VLRTWDGIARLDAHLDRLFETVAPPAQDARAPKLVEAVYRTMRRPAGEHRLRINLTRGAGSPRRVRRLDQRDFDRDRRKLPEQPRAALAVIDWPIAQRAGRGHKTLAYPIT